MAGFWFWLRWSGRDLRRRWLVVGSIAGVVAIGTGAYAGLSSLSGWRRASNDASYAALRFHDLRVTLGTGSSAAAGALRAVTEDIPARADVIAVQERLVAATQVDVAGAGGAVLKPGRMIGVAVDGRDQIDTISVRDGRALGAADAGRPVAILDRQFAAVHDVPVGAQMTLAGGGRLTVVGHGVSPEYFYVTAPSGGGFGAEGGYAIVYASLATVQATTGQVGRVNDVVLRLRDGADAATVAAQLKETLARRLPNLGAEVLGRRDDDGYRVLYDDIGSDQRIYDIFAVILLGAGTFAAFNLASRIVESQRRELGMGMALGAPPGMLAVRPLMLGVQIAVIGVALGVPFGLWIGGTLLDVFKDALPMPNWQTPFATGAFARAAALGIALPILATAIPTLRAVRMPPVDALKPAFRAARGTSIGRIARRLRIPGGTVAQMPIRNLLRAPRRTLLTVLGIAAAVTTSVGVTGMVDAFTETIHRSSVALVGDNRDRVTVTLAQFTPGDAATVSQIADVPGVSQVERDIVVPGSIHAGSTKIDVLLTLSPAGSDIFVPALSDGDFHPGGDGLVITRKAAEDLGVRVGDTLTLTHPRRVGATAVAAVASRVQIVGLVDNPLRTYAYMDISQAALLNLAGMTNTVQVQPDPAVAPDALSRSLMGIGGVAAVERIAAAADSLERAISQYTDVLRVISFVALLLALLIAFNSASIAADERAREYATMFAFGIPVRTVIRNAMVEGTAAGVLATAAGIVAGLAVIRYVVNVTLPSVAPDFGAVVTIGAGTVVTGALVGVVAAAAAPLLTLRRLKAMDVPSTLRVVE